MAPRTDRRESATREASYPIRIIRYPAQDSLSSDEQRMGVVMGQFIRAQRICSHMSGFKDATLPESPKQSGRQKPEQREETVGGEKEGHHARTCAERTRKPLGGENQGSGGQWSPCIPLRTARELQGKRDWEQQVFGGVRARRDLEPVKRVLSTQSSGGPQGTLQSPFVSSSSENSN